jgi:hypothetical protein
VPLNPGTVLLLTDGTLFAQDISSTNWWRLRPLATGYKLAERIGRVSESPMSTLR